MVRRAAGHVGRVGVRPHAVGDFRSTAVGRNRPIRAHHSDRQHGFPPHVLPWRRVLTRERAVLGGPQPRRRRPVAIPGSTAARLPRYTAHRSRRSCGWRYPLLRRLGRPFRIRRLLGVDRRPRSRTYLESAGPADGRLARSIPPWPAVRFRTDPAARKAGCRKRNAPRDRTVGTRGDGESPGRGGDPELSHRESRTEHPVVRSAPAA